MFPKIQGRRKIQSHYLTLVLLLAVRSFYFCIQLFSCGKQWPFMTTNMKTRGLHHSTLKWLLKNNEGAASSAAASALAKNDVLNISLHH